MTKMDKLRVNGHPLHVEQAFWRMHFGKVSGPFVAATLLRSICGEDKVVDENGAHWPYHDCFTTPKQAHQAALNYLRSEEAALVCQLRNVRTVLESAELQALEAVA